MSHAHQHGLAGSGRRLIIALLLNVGITVAQVIGGILSGSLSLLADAAHNGSDAASLGISYGAHRLAQRPADRRLTFGYQRARHIGAMINLTVLFVVGVYLLYAAIRRVVSPLEVEGMTMLIVGGIAFVEDAVSTWLLYQDVEDDQNIRAAFLHLFADTLATAGVMVGALLILFLGISWVDPAITIGIALYVLVHSSFEMRETIAVLLNSAPSNFEFDAMVAAVEDVEGVQSLRHVHVWRMDGKRVAMEAHVAVGTRDVKKAEKVKQRIRERLADFEIDHATLEIEYQQDEGRRASVLPEE